MITYHDILEFWFKETSPEQRFQKDADFDQLIHDRFGDIHTQATLGELACWRETIHGRLAEIIILDQFSRNLYRVLPQSFAYDGMALVLSQEAIATGKHLTLSPDERAFIFMPFMHSESKVIHLEAYKLFSDPELSHYLDFEIAHKMIIDVFDRYPHRNDILNRVSTPEEIAFLKEPNSSF